jgi:probable phosphoglycerate mutase
VTDENAPALTSVVLIRHGESLANAGRLIGGPRSCGGLSALGRAQVEALGRRLKSTGELDGCVLMSSHFRRAVETASIIGAALGIGNRRSTTASASSTPATSATA